MALVPKGYSQIADVSAAAGLETGTLGAIPATAKHVLINPETQSVRWRDDGTNPTASVGILVAAGDSFVYSGPLSKIKLIQTAATAKVNLSFYG